MGVYKRGHVWWYRFTWKGKAIRESTKQTNKRVAGQIEAAHKTSLAKGEVGIRDRKPTQTLQRFAFVSSTFATCSKTKAYYQYGVKSLLGYNKLADERLDTIASETIAGFVAKRKQDELQIASINRELQVLRRMFHLAQEWGKLEKVPPRPHASRRASPGEGSELGRRKALPGRGSAAIGRCGDDPDRLRPTSGGMFPPQVGKRARRLD